MALSSKHKSRCLLHFSGCISRFHPLVSLPHKRTYRLQAFQQRRMSASRPHTSSRRVQRSVSLDRTTTQRTMGSSAAVTKSLCEITKMKLEMLYERQKTYHGIKAKVLDTVSTESSLPGKVRVLLNAFDKFKIDVPKHISTSNLSQFLEQSSHDQIISATMLKEWQMELQQALEIPTRKYEHAVLFGKMITDWLEGHENVVESPSLDSSGMNLDEAFEKVGRHEMHEQRQQWEALVFKTPERSDPMVVTNYLEKTFDTEGMAKKLSVSPLDTLRDDVRSFKLGRFDLDFLKTAIKGLIKADLLSGENLTALMELQANPAVLSEMVDVLNMQVDALESWNWGKDALPVEMRRALNGKYRVFMDEEPFQAVLLHFIGMKWAVHLKQCFTDFLKSDMWKQSSEGLRDKKARIRREYFLPNENKEYCVAKTRHETYQSDWFMQQLPSSFDQGTRDYNDTEAKELTEDEVEAEKKASMALKQSLLHMVSAECLVNTKIHGSFTILQSDFEWFGPSLPHDTVRSVLEFLGVRPFWQDFFQKFLQTPMVFLQDGPDALARVRQNGVPVSHALSDALSEAVLFCLDFAVNKSTSANLYRFHDDLWFWGPDETAITAWETIQSFAKVMGLRLNEEKTGSARITGQPFSEIAETVVKALPTGKICWGFLTLSSATGEWFIDDSQIRSHIAELRLQLSACKSILAWVQAWNSYVCRFLSNNFGEPANALGKPHVTMVIEALKRIQTALFSVDGFVTNNITEKLKSKIAARFGHTTLPDGFLYLPLEQGGLGLRNPLIPLLLIHQTRYADPANKTLAEKVQESRWADPAERVLSSKVEDERLYKEAARKYKEDGRSGRGSHTRYLDEEDDEEFMSLKEYMAYREETSVPLWNAYNALLRKPESRDIEVMPQHKGEDGSSRKRKRGVGEMTKSPYERWITELYGDEVVRAFGRLDFADRKLLPVGLAVMLRGRRVRWQG